MAGMVDHSTSLASFSVWCGAYTSPNGTGIGISAVSAATNVPNLPKLDVARRDALGDERPRLEAVSVDVAADADSPSFLAAHPRLPLLYAVAEFDGTVQAYRRTGETRLESVGMPWPAGSAACHIFVDPHCRFLIVTCWGDGAVLFYELDTAGQIVSRASAAPATDPYPGADRQSRAHASALLPDGRVLTTDLGYDVLRVWHVEAGEGLILEQELSLGEGVGPRHLAVHPSGHVYVVTEYSIEVLVIGQDAGERFEVIDRIPATAAGAQPTDAAAEISLNDAGTRVYATVRGSNRLSTFEVQQVGARLQLIGDVDCGGNWPRHHLQLDNWLFVANQLSNEVSVFSLDASSGLPSTPLGSIPIGTPTCLIPRSEHEPTHHEY